MSAAVEIIGIADTSSRLSLKRVMEQFGEVVGCHMGARGVDNPIVRYKTQEFAQAALDALKAGQVWLDGMVLKGEWKNSSRPGPPEGKGGGKGPNRSEGGLDLTSRDIFTSNRSRSRRRRSRSRRRRRSPSRIHEPQRGSSVVRVCHGPKVGTTRTIIEFVSRQASGCPSSL